MRRGNWWSSFGRRGRKLGVRRNGAFRRLLVESLGSSPNPHVKSNLRVVEILEGRCLLSSSPTLIDVLPGEGASSPSNLVNVNGTLFFAADDLTHGVELWKSDGTVAGTRLAKDICPGSGSSNPGNLTNVNGTLFFTANDGAKGVELWKSDGTADGTILVKDISSGGAGSYPGELTAVDGTLFFVTPYGLWKSDGTTDGTLLVKDSIGSELTPMHGTLFFNDGFDLWRSDGTTGGTSWVAELVGGAGAGPPPANLTNVNGTLFFWYSGINEKGLWKSDGTTVGTVAVKNLVAYADNLTNVNDTLFFTTDDGVDGQELWKSDGTTAGTVLVKDICPGSGASDLWQLTNVDGTLFFAANDGTSGLELWASDGTAAGTRLVKDICPGSGSSLLPWSRFIEKFRTGWLTNVGGTLFFAANDGTRGIELWQSDGTDAGTFLVNDICPGIGNSNPRYLANVNGTLFFTANDGTHGTELWAFRNSDNAPPDIAMRSVTANGFGVLTVTYEITAGPVSAFDLDIYRSPDDAYQLGDERLGTVSISSAADLTTGIHTKSFAIGGGSGQVALPGAGAAETLDDYYLLAVADPADIVAEADTDPWNEDNTAVFSGVYHSPAADVFVFGTPGDDMVSVNSPGIQVTFNDRFYNYAEADVTTLRVRTYGGNDNIACPGANRPLWASAGAGNDQLAGGPRNDTLIGGAGDDELTGGPGNDTLIGGAGNDHYPFDTDENLGSDTIVEAGYGWDNLDFSPTTTQSVVVDLSLAGRQRVNPNLWLTLTQNTIEGLNGGSLDDTLIGNDLDNGFWGGPGNDTLIGRAGSDGYHFDTDEALGSDTIVDSAGEDYLWFAETTTQPVTVDLSIAGPQTVNQNLALTLSAKDAIAQVRGGSLNDTLIGNDLDNGFWGGPGNDTLVGGGGDDFYDFDCDEPLGSDTIIDAGGTWDWLWFSSTTTQRVSVDLSIAGPQVVNPNLTLTLSTTGGVDDVCGGSLDDVLIGNGQNNVFIGGPGNDTLSGGSGTDTYEFDADEPLGSDTIVEAGGNHDCLLFWKTTTLPVRVDLSRVGPQIVNENLTLTLPAGGAIDGVVGGSMDDTLIGNELANSLEGGAGNDTIVGQSGNDTLAGGSGNDTYLFDCDGPLGSDVIDESAGGIDWLDFSETTSKTITISLADSRAQSVNANLRLTLGSANTIENVVGGAMADKITGNVLDNVLLGGYGNDTLRGGAGRDLLVGGKGADQVFGGTDEDILIGGTTSYFDETEHTVDLLAFERLMAEWTRTDEDYATRVNHVRFGTGLNDPYRLDADTVSDDRVRDKLWGEAGRDWFLPGLNDLTPDWVRKGRGAEIKTVVGR